MVIPNLQRADLVVQCSFYGEWVAGSSGAVPVINPADGATLATIAGIGAEETRRAVEAADRAQKSWK